MQSGCKRMALIWDGLSLKTYRRVSWGKEALEINNQLRYYTHMLYLYSFLLNIYWIMFQILYLESCPVYWIFKSHRIFPVLRSLCICTNVKFPFVHFPAFGDRISPSHGHFNLGYTNEDSQTQPGAWRLKCRGANASHNFLHRGAGRKHGTP